MRWTLNLAAGIALALGFAWVVGPRPIGPARPAPAAADGPSAPGGSAPIDAAATPAPSPDEAPARAQAALERPVAPATPDCPGAPLERVAPPYTGLTPGPDALALMRAARGGAAADSREALQADAARAAAAVADLVITPLHANEFAALVAVADELGEEGLRGSILLARLNANDRTGVGKALAALESPPEGPAALRARQQALFACGRARR